MTDAQLRDAAVAALKRTRISLPEWQRRVAAGRYADVTATEWWRALDLLGKIGATPPPSARPFVVVTADKIVSAVAAAPNGSDVRLKPGVVNAQQNFWGTAKKDPANPVRVYAESGEAVFTGSGQRGYPAFSIGDCSGVTFGAGIRLSNPVGDGAKVERSAGIRFARGFRVTDCGMQGMLVQANDGDTNRDIDGDGVEFARCGQDITTDPHLEPGWGLHALYFGGGNTTGRSSGAWTNTWVHDCKNGPPVHVGPCVDRFELNAFTVQRSVSGGDPCAAVNVWGDNARNVTIRNGVVDDVAVGVAGKWNARATVDGLATQAVGRPTIESWNGVVTLTVARVYAQLGSLKLDANGVPAADSPLVGLAAGAPSVDFHGRPRTRNTIGAFEAAA